MLMPGKPVPALDLPTLDHGRFDLSQGGENGTLLLFYRGLHCPICMGQLGQFDARLDEIAAKGVEVAAISTDGEDRTRQTVEKAEVKRLRMAHSLPLEEARDWGLYISAAREGSQEPALFSEPGLFYVRPDGKLYFGWVQTSPFGRPELDGVIKGLGMAVEKGYPPRGMYEGALSRAA